VGNSVHAWAQAPSTLSPAEACTPGHGFLLDKGVFTIFAVPGASRTAAFDIDDRGRIVGFYVDVVGPSHGFLRDSSGHFITIAVPGAATTVISSINDYGQMVGQFVGAGGDIHGFMLDQDAITIIDGPDGVIAAPVAINNHGDIVSSLFDGVRLSGFLLTEGMFTRITPPGAFFPYLLGTLVTDIDDRGRIAGASL
jgi:hypothetical protein